MTILLALILAAISLSPVWLKFYGLPRLRIIKVSDDAIADLLIRKAIVNLTAARQGE